MRLPRSLEDLRGRRAALWIRESSRGQFDTFGPDAQRALAARAIERHELVDTGLAWQTAHSGRTVHESAAWQEMLAAARAGGFDVLLVGYVSRFARNLLETLKAIHEQLHPAGVVIFFCDEGLLSSDERRLDELEREAQEAGSYSRRLARRIREGYESKFRRLGDQGGVAGLGFRRVDGVLQIDPATIGRAVAVFERYATGAVSFADLEAETGIRADAIRAMLAAPIYNGWAVRRRRALDAERVPAPWRSNPPVSDELWARVQEVRHEHFTGGGGQRKRVHLLARRLWCVCGRRIRADIGSFKGRDYRRYRHPNPCAAWSTQTVRAELLEDQVARQVGELRIHPGLLSRLRRLAGEPTSSTGSTELLRRQLERELSARASAHASRRISTEAYLAEHARLSGAIDALKDTPDGVQMDPDRAIAWLRDLRSAWRAADEASRAQLVAAIFRRLTVARERFVEMELTPEARAHGLALALPEVVVLARQAGFEPAAWWSEATRSIH